MYIIAYIIYNVDDKIKNNASSEKKPPQTLSKNQL